MADISIWLFGKPAWEFNENVTSKEVRLKGEELKERLYEVAEKIDKLTTAGWSFEMTLYDLQFSKEISKKQAEKELKRLGIDEEVQEWDEE